MMNQIKAEGEKLGVEVIVGDGQVSSTKQTADVEAAISRGVNGIVISPNEVDAMAPALQEAVDAKIPVVTIDRYVTKVPDLLGHVGADNSKGGEAQAELIMKLFPNGAKIMNLQGQPGAGPAIDRNKGLHNILDQHKDKYEIVFEQTAEFDRVKGLTVTEAALAGMQTPPDVIVAANDDMILGAMEAVKAHNLGGKIALIGFRRPAGGSGPGEGRQPDRHGRAVPRPAELEGRGQARRLSSGTAPSRSRRSSC